MILKNARAKLMKELKIEIDELKAELFRLKQYNQCLEERLKSLSETNLVMLNTINGMIQRNEEDRRNRAMHRNALIGLDAIM